MKTTTALHNPKPFARTHDFIFGPTRSSRSWQHPIVHFLRGAVAASLMIAIVPSGVSSAYAQAAPLPPQPGQYAQLNYDQLGQLVAPIALYPDSLIAQILAASTYPNQIVEADRFVEANMALAPQERARVADTQMWDPSVKALTGFPSVLADMDRNLEWTTKLGNAYYNQPQDVMGAVQTMRQRAYAAGTLHSTPQLNVVYQPSAVFIAPANPAVVYVPMYNPWMVYGAPVPVYPAYTYVAPAPPAGGVAMAATIGFAAGVAVASFGTYTWGYAHWNPNWYSHTVVYNHATYVSRSVTVVNHGYYGYYDHSPAARAYNRQVYVGPNNGVTSRTAVRGYGQTDVWSRGPNGGTYERSTTHYAGGDSTTVTGPDGRSATHTVTGRGTGDVTGTTTGTNGSAITRDTQHFAGGNTTTVTGTSGQSATRTVTGRGTGDVAATTTGPNGGNIDRQTSAGPNGRTTSVTTTNRNGQTQTRTATRRARPN